MLTPPRSGKSRGAGEGRKIVELDQVTPEPKKKAKTSDMLLESYWPEGFTRTMVDGWDKKSIVKIREGQLLEKKLAGKETPLPGKELQVFLQVDISTCHIFRHSHDWCKECCRSGVCGSFRG